MRRRRSFPASLFSTYYSWSFRPSGSLTSWSFPSRSLPCTLNEALSALCGVDFASRNDVSTLTLPILPILIIEPKKAARSLLAALPHTPSRPTPFLPLHSYLSLINLAVFIKDRNRPHPLPAAFLPYRSPANLVALSCPSFPLPVEKNLQQERRRRRRMRERESASESQSLGRRRGLGHLADNVRSEDGIRSGDDR